MLPTKNLVCADVAPNTHTNLTNLLVSPGTSMNSAGPPKTQPQRSSMPKAKSLPNGKATGITPSQCQAPASLQHHSLVTPLPTPPTPNTTLTKPLVSIAVGTPGFTSPNSTTLSSLRLSVHQYQQQSLCTGWQLLERAQNVEHFLSADFWDQARLQTNSSQGSPPGGT